MPRRRHEFVVVETIEFFDDEDADLPPPLTLKDVITMNKVRAQGGAWGAVVAEGGMESSWVLCLVPALHACAQTYARTHTRARPQAREYAEAEEKTAADAAQATAEAREKVRGAGCAHCVCALSVAYVLLGVRGVCSVRTLRGAQVLGWVVHTQHTRTLTAPPQAVPMSEEERALVAQAAGVSLGGPPQPQPPGTSVTSAPEPEVRTRARSWAVVVVLLLTARAPAHPPRPANFAIVTISRLAACPPPAPPEPAAPPLPSQPPPLPEADICRITCNPPIPHPLHACAPPQPAAPPLPPGPPPAPEADMDVDMDADEDEAPMRVVRNYVRPAAPPGMRMLNGVPYDPARFAVSPITGAWGGGGFGGGGCVRV